MHGAIIQLSNYPGDILSKPIVHKSQLHTSNKPLTIHILLKKSPNFKKVFILINQYSSSWSSLTKQFSRFYFLFATLICFYWSSRLFDSTLSSFSCIKIQSNRFVNFYLNEIIVMQNYIVVYCLTSPCWI